MGPDRLTVTPENVGDKVHLRVELQSLWRLPRSNAHPLRHPLLPDQDGRTGDRAEMGPPLPARAARPAAELIDYKGLTRYRQTTVEWLSKYDDGAATSPGFSPD
jgi:hypothetical protein